MANIRNITVPYLFQRGKIYYFRYQLSRVQSDLAGLREIKVSLRTDNRRIATYMALSMGDRVRQIFEMTGKLTPLNQEKVTSWLKAYLLAEIKNIQEAVAKAHIEKDFDPSFQTEMWSHEKAALIQNIEDHQYQRQTTLLAQRLCRETNSVMPPPGSIEYDDLSRDAALADLKRAIFALEKYTLDPEEYILENYKSPALNQSESKVAETSEYLSDVINAYKEEYWKGSNTKKTCAEMDKKIGYFLEWMGKDIPITEITINHIRDYRNDLLKLPAHHGTHSKLKNLGFKDKIKNRKGFPLLKVKSQKKYYGTVTAFFSWCENSGYIANSPVGKIKIKSNPKESIVKLPFSQQELQIILKAPLFIGYQSEKKWTVSGKIKKRRAEYWFILIAMLGGLRIGEIVQLRNCDLKHIHKDNIGWIIDINDDDDKSVKTTQSVRQVPLHDILVKLGFPEWADKSCSGKEKRFIFKDFQPGGKGEPSKKVSPKFNRFLRKLGLHTKQKTFHSFRHSFKDALKTGGVALYDIDKLMGHSSDKGNVKYGTGSELENLRKAIDSIYKKLDFSHL